MGDPECQAILPRLNCDLFEIINFAVNDKLYKAEINWKNKKSICIVLCTKGYPNKYAKNLKITKI